MPQLRIGLLLTLLLAIGPPAISAQDGGPASLGQLREWASTLSNRGRWGAQDRLGTLNLITPAKRRSAAQLVRAGVTVSLAHDLVPGENLNAIQPMTQDYFITPVGPTVWGADGINLLPHGWAYSHLDALSHAAFDGAFYNGYEVETLTESGSALLGIDAMREGMASRGVLIDLPWLDGVEYLEPGTVVTAADLEAWEQRTGERVDQGDVLLVRTGRWAREQALGPWRLTESAAGLHPSVAVWLRERGVAALGGDGSSERYPSLVDGISDPLHMLTLSVMGLPLFDNLDFEDLARTALQLDRRTFFFIASPLRVRGGSGSAVNPLAIF